MKREKKNVHSDIGQKEIKYEENKKSKDGK